MWVNRPLQVSQLGQLSLSSFLGRQTSSVAVVCVEHVIAWVTSQAAVGARSSELISPVVNKH